MASVQISDVRKSFGGFEVLHGVTVPIEDGAFVVLVGLFNGRRRLLHDFVLGTVVINNSVRAPVPQAARTY